MKERKLQMQSGCKHWILGNWDFCGRFCQRRACLHETPFMEGSGEEEGVLYTNLAFPLVFDFAKKDTEDGDESKVACSCPTVLLNPLTASFQTLLKIEELASAD